MKVIIYPDYDLWNFILDSLHKKEDVKLFPLNKYCSIPQIIIRKRIKSRILPSSFLIGRKLRYELSQLKESDSVIVCDYMNVGLLAAISKCASLPNKHLWVWNPLDDLERYFTNHINQFKNFGFKVHTFNEKDSYKYGLEKHNQFFPIMEYIDSKHDNLLYDFYFLGFDKGRKNMIDSLRSRLSNYTNKILLVNNKNDYISYSENINNILSTKCIIDIVQEGQDGQTLRPLEAITFKKKLLTNNSKIRYEDFYHPNNIFIIGHDNWNDFNDFYKKDYFEIPQDILLKYDISSWINCFD